MPAIRIDSDVARLLEKDIAKLSMTIKPKIGSMRSRLVSPNTVVRIWLGLDKPRGGVKKREM